jgi:hypothetical protein
MISVVKVLNETLTKSLNIISNSLNNGAYCIGVFINSRKAFNICSHKILQKLLHHPGIKDRALAWFKSYLGTHGIQFKKIYYLPLQGGKS